MNVSEFMTELRDKLYPRGINTITKLTLKNCGYVDHVLVAAALDELERKMLIGVILEPTSALEKLGILLLTESE